MVTRGGRRGLMTRNLRRGRLGAPRTVRGPLPQTSASPESVAMRACHRCGDYVQLLTTMFGITGWEQLCGMCLADDARVRWMAANLEEGRSEQGRGTPNSLPRPHPRGPI